MNKRATPGCNRQLTVCNAMAGGQIRGIWAILMAANTQGGHHHDHRTDHCRRTPEAGIIPALYSSTTCPPLSLDSGLIFQDCVAGTPCTLRNRGSITCTVPNQPELADVMTQEVHAAAVRAELWQDGKKLADCLPVPAAEDLPLPEGGATAYSFQLPEIEVTMEADSWIGVVFIATDNLGRTSTNGEFFTIQDDMLIFTDDTDPIWEAIRAAQDSE